MGLNQRLVTDLVFKISNPPPLLSPTVNAIDSASDIPTILLGPIPPGATVIVQHGLHEGLLGPTAPTIVFPDRISPLVVTAANKLTVTIFNPDLFNAQEVIFRAERKHTLEETPGLLVDMLWQGAPVSPSNVQELTGSGCVSPNASIVRFPTDTEEPLIYLASVADGADGRLVTFRITSGFLDAILLPNDLSEGINGPPGSTYTLSALEASATFEADVARKIWWKVG